jgi:hypothetical protein
MDWLTEHKRLLLGPEGEIFKAVSSLILQRIVWLGYQDILKGAPEPVKESLSEFAWWAQHNYVESVGIGIRRIADTRSQTISLARFLGNLANDSHHVTRTQYLSWFPDGDQRDASQRFRSFATPALRKLDKGKVLEDRKRLLDDSNEVTEWVNTHVAHFDGRRVYGSLPSPTYSKMHQTIDHIVNMYQKYEQFFSGSATQFQSFITTPWEFAFNFAWVPGYVPHPPPLATG